MGTPAGGPIIALILPSVSGCDGIIRLSHVQADYSWRLPVEDLLSGLRKLP